MDARICVLDIEGGRRKSVNEWKDGVAVVTGAGSGLGSALARRFAEAGMKVVLADLAFENAKKVAQELAATGASAKAMPVDIGDEGSIETLAERVEAEVGPCRVLCANVGVQQLGTVESLSRADWEWVFGVNVFGTVATTRIFLPQMRRAEGERRILVTASTSALYPASHMSAYVSSKYAVLGLAETLRIELATEGIGVTAILPGPMSTTHLQSSQLAKPHASGAPVFTSESIEVVAAATGGEMIDADRATRNVLSDLLENRPYTITHDVHRDQANARFSALGEAFERAKR